jgi:hypothetical protein
MQHPFVPTFEQIKLPAPIVKHELKVHTPPIRKPRISKLLLKKSLDNHKMLQLGSGMPSKPTKASPTMGTCSKCKTVRAMTGVTEVVAKDGRHMIKGKCSTCKTVVSKFVKKLI